MRTALSRLGLLCGSGLCVPPTPRAPALTPLPVALSVPPQVQPGPRVLKVLVGEAVDLNCVAEGSPEPRVTWSKDGVALRGEGPEGSVHFAAIQTSHAGTYRCEASSSAGVDAWELDLRVLGEWPPTPRAPWSPHLLQPPAAVWASELLDCFFPPDLRPHQAALTSPGLRGRGSFLRVGCRRPGVAD